MVGIAGTPILCKAAFCIVAKFATGRYYGDMPSLHEMIRLTGSKARLKDLIDACPELWQDTGSKINIHLGGLVGASSKDSSSALNAYVHELENKARAWRWKTPNGSIDREMLAKAFPDLVRARMSKLALQNHYLAALAGKSGKVRFSFWNGMILQRLLFRRGFERKPVRLFWYNLLWNLVSQKKILMRLVYQKGIYCFYSKALLTKLAALIRSELKPGEMVLELAAGDGTLSRFLTQKGIEMLACDDYSWQKNKNAPDIPGVLRLDAATAIRKYEPSVVVCSWPPAGNNFEKSVFENSATRLYIVVGSRHQFASGNWATYAEHAGTPAAPGPFQMIADANLSRLVLPQELDNLVLIFRRR